jgi:uncharacterized protein (DUF1501 family)
MPRLAMAAQGRDARFVTIILRGALDGLTAVPPLGDPDYEGIRGGIALHKDGNGAALPLDGFFSLHPSMPNFARLYHANQASIVHASATAYRDRSHFDGQDVLESGYEMPGKVDSGWLNRLLIGLPRGDKVAPGTAEKARGLAVGANAPLVIRGQAPVLGWAPASLPPADDDLAVRLMDLYTHRDPVLARALSEGIATGKIASGMDVKPRGGPGDPNGMKQLASGAAKLLAQADGPRVAALAFEGWDTHAQEIGRLARLLVGLDDALATFETELGPAWKDTVILVATEFGRTAHVNGTDGTDHGTGTTAFLAGGAVKGGRVIADWPGLKEAQLKDGRDLMPTTDLRAVVKGIAVDLLGASPALLAKDVFPGSDKVAPMKGLVI